MTCPKARPNAASFGLSALALACVLLAPVSTAQAQDAFAGVFFGWVDSGGERTRMETMLAVGVDGRLKGRYTFDEPTRRVDGWITVTDARGDDIHVVWMDLYGEGRAVLTFTADRAAFDGVWYDGAGFLGGVWTGCRIDPATWEPAPSCPTDAMS